MHLKTVLRTATLLTLSLALPAPLLYSQNDSDKSEIAQLREEIEILKQRLSALEAAQDPESSQPGPVEDQRSSSDTAERGNAESEPNLDSPFAERNKQAESPLEQKTEDKLTWKGALRFTYFLNDYDREAESRYGDSGLDLFRIGVDGQHQNFLVSAEYRWYPYMETLHHGWIGYQLPEGDQVQLGVSQVPFGILPYASHNFWFGIPYYIGLSDDYDLGIQYVRERGPWNLNLAFYKNEELGSATNLDRYSFDVVQVGAEQNRETNQANARLTYTLNRDTSSVHELGLSGQWGQLFNSTTGNTGDHWAVAGHLDSRIGRWNFQLELAHYEYNPKNPPGLTDQTVRLGAFSGSYDISSKGSVAVANAAYNMPVPWEFLDQILLYNDFSILFKDFGFEESQLNTTGAAIGVGPLFIYLDLIHARNMVYFEDGSLAGQGNHEWSRRLNLNLGYYW